MGASLAGAGLVGAAACLGSEQGAPVSAPVPANADGSLGPGPVDFTLKVNGATRAVRAEPRQTLLAVLRGPLALTGTKPVCERGECGACTVLIDDRPRLSCLTLALDARGREIRTIEGLSTESPEATGAFALAPADRRAGLDPVQRAFLENDALMCGFCTPGLVLSVRGLLDRSPRPSPAEIRAATSGNLCRCGTYVKVFAAALAAARMPRA